MTQQTEFTGIEAVAICKMLAELVKDGYAIKIGPDVDEQSTAYGIAIFDDEEITVTDSKGHCLIDALADAFGLTPEMER